MEEHLAELIEAFDPGASSTMKDLDLLTLETKYIPALEPNYALVRLLYRKVTLTHGTPKASICVVHGFGEHSGKYLRSAALFALRGYEVHLLDQRNCGLSGGPRGSGDMYEFLRDVNKLMQQARPDLPCFLWGHSQGGLLVTYLTQLNPYLRLAGVIVTSPLYSLARPVPGVMRWLLPLVVKYFPYLLVNGLVVPANISQADSYLYQLFQDKLSFPFLGLQHALSILSIQDFVLASGKALSCPFLCYHGAKDVITSHETAASFFKSVGSTDKELKIDQDGYHEPHHDRNKDNFIEELLTWMDGRLPKAKPLSLVGNVRSTIDKKPGSSWTKRLLILFFVAYLIVALRFKARLGANLIRFLAFTLLPKVLWPVFLIAGLLKR